MRYIAVLLHLVSLLLKRLATHHLAQIKPKHAIFLVAVPIHAAVHLLGLHAFSVIIVHHFPAFHACVRESLVHVAIRQHEIRVCASLYTRSAIAGQTPLPEFRAITYSFSPVCFLRTRSSLIAVASTTAATDTIVRIAIFILVVCQIFVHYSTCTFAELRHYL